VRARLTIRRRFCSEDFLNDNVIHFLTAKFQFVCLLVYMNKRDAKEVNDIIHCVRKANHMFLATSRHELASHYRASKPPWANVVAASAYSQSSMASNKQTPWKESVAKDMLTNDILEGLVTLAMKPKAVLAMHPELYAPYAKNFSANYRSLQQSIESLHA
jgi:hypothetical protein